MARKEFVFQIPVSDDADWREQIRTPGLVGTVDRSFVVETDGDHSGGCALIMVRTVQNYRGSV